MTQRKLKLTLWPTLFTIPALLVLVGLGTWQLQRMQWKSEIIDTFEERISDEAVAPPLKVTNIEKWRFKRVALMGKFLHKHEFFHFACSQTIFHQQRSADWAILKSLMPTIPSHHQDYAQRSYPLLLSQYLSSEPH